MPVGLRTSKWWKRSIQIAARGNWKLRAWTFAHVLSGGTFGLHRHSVFLMRRIQRGIERALVTGKPYSAIINLPPQHGKSTAISHWLASWYLATVPSHRVMLAGYNAKFAARWGKKCRDTLQPLGLVNGRAEVDDWETGQGDGGMQTAGIGGAYLGAGYQLGIIDDPTKNWEEAKSAVYQETLRDWADTTFFSRRRSGACTVVIMTRWHKGDFTAWLLEEHPEFDWDHIVLPDLCDSVDDPMGRKLGEPLCAELYSVEECLLKRASAGSEIRANAIYRQVCETEAGELFQREWFVEWRPEELPLPGQWDSLVVVWDLTFGGMKKRNSFVVGQIWGRKGHLKYLLYQERFKGPFTAQLEAMARLHRYCVTHFGEPDKTLVENKALGAGAIDLIENGMPDLSKETSSGNGSAPPTHFKIPNLEPVDPEASKETRAEVTAVHAKYLLIRVPPSNLFFWVKAWKDEHVQFPLGLNDDQVDCTSYAVTYLQTERDLAIIAFGPRKEDLQRAAVELRVERRGGRMTQPNRPPHVFFQD